MRLSLGKAFRSFAAATARAAGSVWAFLLALAVLLLWAISGPLYNFSDTWQLACNTGTTIVTFLMVFLIGEHPEPRCSGHTPQTG